MIEIHAVRLHFILNGTMLSGYFHFGNNHFSAKFSFFKDIFQVLTDCRHPHPKELSHSLLRTPKRFLLDDHLYLAIGLGHSVKQKLYLITHR